MGDVRVEEAVLEVNCRDYSRNPPHTEGEILM